MIFEYESGAQILQGTYTYDVHRKGEAEVKSEERKNTALYIAQYIHNFRTKGMGGE